MEGVLPEEFPFSARHRIALNPPPVSEVAPAPQSAPESQNPATTQATAEPAPVAAAAIVPAPVAPVPVVQHIEEEPLVEIASSGQVVYRGRERRRSPRQALRAKAVYRDDVNTASNGPVQVINISMFGVRLWSARPLQSGNRGSIRLELGPVKWSSMMRVVSVDPNQDEGYVVGCEFVAKELPRRRVDAA
jgi:hypothetical protein